MLLEAHQISVCFSHRKHFWKKAEKFWALSGVSMHLAEGETLGIVGESGSGKSTLAKVLAGLIAPKKGTVYFKEDNIHTASRQRRKQLCRQLQMVLQDPTDSLNPRHTIATLLEEPFIVHGLGTKAEREQWIKRLMQQVGLSADALHKFPFEFSGGQRQRINIARAIALQPCLLICDEPTSSLDVSIQGQILNLLLDLQNELNASLLFISHDLALIKQMSHRILVMKEGSIVETGLTDEVLKNPQHPYTQKLVRIAKSFD